MMIVESPGFPSESPRIGHGEAVKCQCRNKCTKTTSCARIVLISAEANMLRHAALMPTCFSSAVL